MASQTNLLDGGHYIADFVNSQTILKTSAPAKQTSEPQYLKAPTLGVLTKTLVESPVTRWILPLSIRSTNRKDIAFIGDHFVQISELCKDGQLYQVFRKTGFCPRIRSAAVLGVGLDYGTGGSSAVGLKSEDNHPPKEASTLEQQDALASHGELPPQVLVLMLENGDTIFLFLTQRSNATFEFVVSKYKLPKSVPYIGYHLAIDPSSRYMAAATPEGIFVIYHLESWNCLKDQYLRDGSFSPIKQVHFRTVQGFIHNMDFLFPRPEDDYHIILLLIIVRKEKQNAQPTSRMITYEWELGDNLKSVFQQEKVGNRLPAEHRMPMLLIPLKFKTAFFAVSKSSIGVVKHALSGSPQYERLSTDMPGRTRLHNGKDEPLWTAWTRPVRLRSYFQKTDIIFLAREDGAIIHVEIDQKEMVPSVINVGCLDTNINTAFATSDDIFSDVLIIQGDSGPGGLWKLAPRSDMEQVNITPNWSPVIDVATTYEPSTPTSVIGRRSNGMARATQKPDCIFTASGRGLKGSITQWRWGLQAKIGLEIESGEPNRHAWIFPAKNNGFVSLLGILALPHSSRILQFAKDFSQVHELGESDISLDLSTRTLFATQQPGGRILQITECYMCIAGGSERCKKLIGEVLDIPDVKADKAHSLHNATVLSVQQRDLARIFIIRQQDDGFHLYSRWAIEGEITALSFFSTCGQQLASIALVHHGQSHIFVLKLDGSIAWKTSLNFAENATDFEAFEAVTSICAINDESSHSVLVMGTRCGRVLTMQASNQRPGELTWMTETIGISAVEVFPAAQSLGREKCAFATCDGTLLMLSKYSARKGLFCSKSVVILTDSNDLSIGSPPIHAICSLDESLSGYVGHLSLLMLAGSRILMTEILPQMGHVPRSIPLEGTPCRVIYSRTWKCLVVALIKDDQPTLVFVDPDTGATISDPSDKGKNSSEFISGLGHQGDRIYSLHEWLYVKDGSTFSYILVTTKDGRLLIISVMETEVMTESGPIRRLKHWTRYKKWLSCPISSVVGDTDGLIFCANRTLYWEVLDVAEKRLKPMKEYLLDSPAVSLRIVDGNIHALTQTNSLEVINYRTGAGSDMALLHTDRVSRRTTHILDIGCRMQGSEAGPVTLLADYKKGFAGVWIPREQDNQELEAVFEGLLLSSVRRFVRCRSRPPWVAANRGARYGALSSSDDGAEVLGVSLDGALHQFTLIEVELLRFLCLIQTLAHRSRIPVLNPLYSPALGEDSSDEEMDLEPQLHPRLMHIDGDVLQKCLENTLLEKLVGDGDGLDLFCEYLDGIEGGLYTSAFRDCVVEERYGRYFEAAYEILEYLLAPAI